MKGLVYDIKPAGWLACLAMKRFWPGCVTSRLSGLSLRELPRPELPGPDWALCRTVLGGVCGSDLAIIGQRQPIDSVLQAFTTLPMVLGHENVAVVEAVGEQVDRAWLGRRVCVEPTLACAVRGIDPPCPSCAAGRFGACQNFGGKTRELNAEHAENAETEGVFLRKGPASAIAAFSAVDFPPGTSLGYCGAVGGCWAEFFPAHVSQLYPVPHAMPDELAVLTDPLACGLHAVLRAELGLQGGPHGPLADDARGSWHPPARVLVYGAGILGLSAVWGLRAVGYKGVIDLVARHAHQQQLGRQLGADETLALPAERAGRFDAIAARTGGRVSRVRFGNLMLSGGYDVVFECAGSAATIEEALKWTTSGGQTVLLATGHGQGADLTPVWFTELKVIGAYGRGMESFAGRRLHTYALAHELMSADAAKLRPLLTHTFPLAEYRRALAVAADKSSGSVKVAFRP